MDVPTLELNGSEIKRVEKTKYLRILNDDENLKWDEQFKRDRSKLYTILMNLKRLINILQQASSAVLIMVLLEVICNKVMLFGTA